MSRDDHIRPAAAPASPSPAPKKLPLYATLLNSFTGSSLNRPRAASTVRGITSASESLAGVLSQQTRREESRIKTTRPDAGGLPLHPTTLSHGLGATLAASSPQQRIEQLTKLAHQVRILDGVDPLAIWLEASFLLSDDETLDVRLASLALLTACVGVVVQAQAGERASGADRGVFWTAVVRFAADCKVLDLPELTLTVTAIDAISRGGRDIVGLTRIVEVLVDVSTEQFGRRQDKRRRFVAKEAPEVPFGRPLYDSTFSSPFVHLSTTPNEVAVGPSQSAIALLTAIHKFSWSHLSPAELNHSAHYIVRYGAETTSDIGLQLALAYVDTAARFGSVPEAVLADVIELVARVVGIEHNILVLQGGLASGPIVRPLQTDLASFARNSMRNLLLSPANQALRHLRVAAGAYVGEGDEKRRASAAPLVLGAVRCLRRTLADYYTNTLLADSHLESLPTLINIGMPLLYDDLLNALEGGVPEIATEVLGILEDRLQVAPALHAEAGVAAGVALTYNEWDMTVDLLVKIRASFDMWAAKAGEAFILDLPSASSLSCFEKQERLRESPVSTDVQPALTGIRATLLAFRVVFARTLAAFSQPEWQGPVDLVCDLFASLRSYLSDESLILLLDFFAAESLCSPSEPNWLARVGDIVSIAHTSTNEAVRRKAVEQLREVFESVKDEPDLRNILVQQQLLAFVDTLLKPEEANRTWTVEMATVVLALLASMLDDALTWADPLPANSSALADIGDPSGRAFDRICESLYALATASAPVSHGRHSRQVSETNGRLILPPSAIEVPSKADAPGVYAVALLVSAFCSATSKCTTSASMRAIVIFRRLLLLLEPESTAQQRVRLTVLAFCVRLRADAEHQIHLTTFIDVETFAQSIDRGSAPILPTSAPLVSEREERRGRNRPKQPIGVSPDRGISRSASRPRQGRSLSRTREIAISAWTTADALPFDIPADCHSGSRGSLVSYDHTLEWSESHSVGGAGGHHDFPDYDQAFASRAHNATVVLPISEYLRVVTRMFEVEKDWEVLAYLLCYLPDQLTNKHLACGPRAARELHKLRSLLCVELKREKVVIPVTLPSNVKNGDVFALLCQTLSTLIAYRSLYNKEQQEEMVATFAQGVRRRDIAKPCIHALTIACHELSPCMPTYLTGILQNLALIITTESMAVNALEFIASVGLLPSLYRSFTDKDYLAVFAIALQYISLHHRDAADAETAKATTPSRPGQSIPSLPPTKSPQAMAFSAYVLHMAYYVVDLWYMSLKVSARKQYVSFITKKLVEATECRGGLDEAAEVCLDMIARYSAANLDPISRHSTLRRALIPVEVDRRSNDLPRKTWLVGHALVTITRLEPTHWMEICVRRPSGIVKMIIEVENAAKDGAADQDVLALVQLHREQFGDLSLPFLDAGESKLDVLPSTRTTETAIMDEASPPVRKSSGPGEYAIGESFLAMQFSSYPDFGTTGPPTLLPTDGPSNSWYLSSLRTLDITPVVDVHAIGVLYVGPGQTDELDIFANSRGSEAYTQMLHGLGEVTRLKGYEGYAGGLDRSDDIDGKWMIAWSNNVTQIVFHATTLIPWSQERDTQILSRKRHLGNDAVKIIYNDSGGPYDFKTVKGQFNWVNILVEPHTPAGKTWSARGMSNNAAFFKVYMQLDPSMPELGPLGAFKMVSAASLGQVVRHLALHADIYAKVHLSEVGFETSHGQQKVEFTSNWRKRLQIIKSVRKRLVEQQRIVKVEAGEPEGMLRDVSKWAG